MVGGPTHSYTCGVLSCVLRFKSKLGGNELLNADALPPGLPLGFLGRPQRTARPFGDFDRDEDGVSSSGLSLLSKLVTPGMLYGQRLSGPA